MPAHRCCWQSLFFALILAAPTVAAADTLAWESDLEGAKRNAARTNRLVLVHFGATWCQPCQQLEREVFSQPGFGKELHPQFVCVKLDFDAHQALARQLGVQSLPTDVIMASDGRVIERLVSPRTVPEYTAAMTRVALASRNTPPGQESVPPAANPAPGDGRYADYYNRQNAAAPDATTQPAAAAAAPGGQPAPGGYSASPASFQPPSGPALTQAAPGNAPFGLDSYCPVTLFEKHVWTKGDPRWGMQHRGQTYLFGSAEDQQRFAENPDKYAPVMSGNDPVLAIDQGQSVPGKRMYGLFCGGHVYLFSSEQTLQLFQSNLSRYTAQALEARRAQP